MAVLLLVLLQENPGPWPSLTLIVSLLSLAVLILSYYYFRHRLAVKRDVQAALRVDSLRKQGGLTIHIPPSQIREPSETKALLDIIGKEIDRERQERDLPRREEMPQTQLRQNPLPYNKPNKLLTALSDPGLIMQIVLSLVVAGAALYMILSGRYDANNQHWAYGIVGTVVGFWLKGAR